MLCIEYCTNLADSVRSRSSPQCCHDDRAPHMVSIEEQEIKDQTMLETRERVDYVCQNVKDN